VIPWEDREAGFRGWVVELQRLMRRARQRPWLVLFLAVASTLLSLAQQLRRQREYPATVVLSATESEQTFDNIVHNNKKLTDYVYYAVFTDRVLVELMDKHEYRTDLAVKNPRMRAENFRDLIDVDVYKNEFIEQRWPNMPPRSARIAIEFRYTDPDDALEIARELGELVIKRDGENRRERLLGKEREFADAQRMAETHLARVSRDLERARYDLDNDVGDRGDAIVRVMGGEKALSEAVARLTTATEMRQKLERAANADEQSLELRYDKADWGAAKTRVNELLALARAALVSFVAFFFIMKLLVASFDSRIYDPDDVTRTGARLFGHVKLPKQARLTLAPSQLASTPIASIQRRGS
jgi:hypothetical protein